MAIIDFVSRCRSNKKDTLAVSFLHAYRYQMMNVFIYCLSLLWRPILLLCGERFHEDGAVVHR